MADDQQTSQQGGAHPPRPGDPVPQEGLDPTQVFASPPPPPQQGGAQGDDDGAQPPQDMGPPPPPVGTQATKEMGYDDEDIKILSEVGDYRFGSVAAQLSNDGIPVPAHPQTVFDEQVFLTLLRSSISLTRDEKWRIIQAIPKLSQFQVDELQKILAEEQEKFRQLSPKHLLQLMRLEQKHSTDWQDLQSFNAQQQQKSEESQQAEEIRRQLGLS